MKVLSRKRTSPKLLTSLLDLKMTQEIAKESQRLSISKADAQKLEVLKTKIAINNMFTNELKSKRDSLQERRILYKNLLLEYHPDKKKHSKEISEEIVDYLLNNKYAFAES